MVDAAGRFAASASVPRLALSLAAVLVAFLLNALAHAPVEQALRAGGCGLWDCLNALRPEARHAGYTAAEFRDFLAATDALRGPALLALVTDLPLIAALVAALLTAAGLAARGLPISDRSRRLLFTLPLGFAAADLAENVLLVLAHARLADVAVIMPWASALKFGLLMASVLLSLVLGLMHALQT